ncbi:MAG: alpha amylase C-terminal domain-containing protein, partial [Lachnospiraceae bacterium]|nr:alpha amylase C-terminal domain-containing protein [Lachnospiraceae bacterium]
VFYRKGLLFAFNFSPSNSYTDVKVSIPNYADYEVAFTTDDWKYGGWGQINHGTYPVQIDENGASSVSLYLPARTAMVLREGEIKQFPQKEEVKEEASVQEKPVKKATKKTSPRKKKLDK